MTIIDLSRLDSGTTGAVVGGSGGGQGATTTLRRFRPDIEGLRALAVALVVLYHAGVPGLNGGFIGVDVFFVVSGYLITTQLLNELTTTGHINLRNFYARRAKRLLPLSVLVTLTTLTATWWLTSPLQTRELATDALWTAAFAMNIHLAAAGVDYATGQDPSALQHYWSLAIEEQFYLLWPLLLLITAATWRNRLHRNKNHPTTPTRTTHRTNHAPPSRTTLNITITLLTAASFAYGVHQTHIAQSLAYFVTPARAWELAIGGLIALNTPTLTRLPHTLNTLLAPTGLAAITTAALLLNNNSAFPGYWALLPTLGTAAVITSGLTTPTPTETHLLTPPPIQGLGRISYGLYLWHWPLLVLAPTYLNTDKLGVLQTAVVVTVSVWLASVTFFFIEDPLRTLALFRRLPNQALTLGAACTVAVMGASAAITWFMPDPRATGNYVEPLKDLAALPQAVTTGGSLRAIPSNVEPNLVEAAEDKPDPTTGDGVSCMVDLLDTQVSRDPKGSCVFGDANGDTTVVLTGDSHAYQWMPAIEPLAVKNKWRLVLLAKSGCALYDVKVVNTMLKRDYRECYEWRENAQVRIAEEKPDLIITSAFTGSANRDSTFTDRWLDGMRSTIGRLKRTGAKVAVIADTPYPAKAIPECLAQNVDSARSCAVQRKVALSDPGRRNAGASEAAAGGARLIDPIPWFCSSASCPAVIANNIVYSDNSHVTATYARTLSPLLEKQLPAL